MKTIDYKGAKYFVYLDYLLVLYTISEKINHIITVRFT